MAMLLLLLLLTTSNNSININDTFFYVLYEQLHCMQCIHMNTIEEKCCQGHAVISKQQPEDSTKVSSEICCFSINFISVTSQKEIYWHFNLHQLCPVNFNASRTSSRLHWHSYSYPLILQFRANVGWLSLQVFILKDKQLRKKRNRERTFYCTHTDENNGLKYFGMSSLLLI